MIWVQLNCAWASVDEGAKATVASVTTAGAMKIPRRLLASESLLSILLIPTSCQGSSLLRLQQQSFAGVEAPPRADLQRREANPSIVFRVAGQSRRSRSKRRRRCG